MVWTFGTSRRRSRDEPTKAKYLLCPDFSLFLDGYRLANSSVPLALKCVLADLTIATNKGKVPDCGADQCDLWPLDFNGLL